MAWDWTASQPDWPPFIALESRIFLQVVDSRKHFATKRKRDAYATIRGFVYQVELTIQRWLDLKVGEALELERGEDVDTIQEAMSGFGNEQSRLLEQIKARVKKLTLRSGSALSALANFYEHDCNNSKLKLSYRYVTSAAVGLERPSATPDRVPLITLWNGLHGNQIQPKDLSARFKQTRAFLAATTKPTKLDAKAWASFISFVGTGSERSFRNFVRRVEWFVSQTPTARVAERVQKKLVSQYGTEPTEAQTTYERLFLHVFKVLSEPGIKRLTTVDRERVLRSPYLNARDQLLLANLSVHLTDLSARVGALEDLVASLSPHALPSEIEIADAIAAITSRTANAIVDGQLVIERASIAKRLDDFVTSDVQYCFLLGSAGVGKSVCLAMNAKRFSAEHGVLLMVAKYFTLANVGRVIADELTRPAAPMSWQNVVKIITSNGDRDLLMFIDAIDEADELNQLAAELGKLHESIGDGDRCRIKVILSCRDAAWPRFRQQALTPLYLESPIVGKHHSAFSAITVSLGDFTTSELDDALKEIGANELVSPGRYGAAPSAHIATVRDLLRHPGTFEHYAALKRSDESVPLENLTWSHLIQQRLSKALEKASRQCGKSIERLREILEALAILAWRKNSKTFELDAGAVKKSAPAILKRSSDRNLSPLAALVENRVLNESLVAGEQRLGFHITDIGAYLVSFELERQIKNESIHKSREHFEQWLKDSWDFYPLLDSLLALLDRLAEQPYSALCLTLVQVLLESHRFWQSSFFVLVHPNVLKTLFEIVNESDEHGFYDCRDAALQMRPSEEALLEIRSHLKDKNPLMRQMAAELAGMHHDLIAVDELIQLLQDNDEDVRQRAYKAFAYFGRPAVDPLLRIIRDVSQSTDLRSSCITALRNIGFRNDQVSLALTKSLEEGKHDAELLKSSLYTAAYLRDRGYHEAATNALRHHDEWIVEGGAKYLTEIPEATAFHKLAEALAVPAKNGEPNKRFWVISQLIVALWKTDRAKSAPILTKLVSEALEGKGDLTPIRAIQLPDKIDLPSIRPLILRKLVADLQESSQGRFLSQSARTLGGTWKMEELDALAAENRNLSRRGVDIAKLFVDSTIPGNSVSEQFHLGDRLNRVSDLITVAKCEAPNFAPEAIRLLRDSGFLTCHDLSRLLWVNGDVRAEMGLIHKLENPSPTKNAKNERFYAVRALGTCSGTQRGVNAVLDYLRSNCEDVSYYFHRETLYPLLIRGLLNTSQVAKLARDSAAPWAGRLVSILALGITNAPAHASLFAEIAQEASEQPRLQEGAVRMLGFSKKQLALKELRHFLREGQHASVREQAAECLAWFNDSASVHAIERALENSHARGFVLALGRFREQSSLPLLLDRLATARNEWRHEYFEALGGFWRYPAGRTAILEQFDKWSSPDMEYRDIQSPLIEGLAEYEPDVILGQFSKAFDDGQLTTGARETMALMMARLFNRRLGNESLTLQVAKRLVCDLYVPARERMCHALGYAKKRVCSRLFHELYESSRTEWERASATYTLGFWNSPTEQIKKARFDGESLVRKAADAALEIRLNKKQLEMHLLRYQSGSNSERLSSYLCLCDHGNQFSIWALNDDEQIKGMALTFRRELTERIKKRVGDEYQKRQRDEKDLPESRGTVTFD